MQVCADALPDEALIHLLGFLPLGQRLRLARVCRRWAQLTVQATTQLCLKTAATSQRCPVR